MLKPSSPRGQSELDWIQARLCSGLDLLALASRYASVDDAKADEFAVTLDSLQARGFNECDLRWLFSNSLVEHLVELTLNGDRERSFREGGAVIRSESCFLLTEKGIAFAEQLVGPPSQPLPANTPGEPTSASHGKQHPAWDPDRQELWFLNKLVKRFRLPSPNQAAILSAFEEEDWPSRVDDPLPPKAEHDPKRRLHDTIRNLNRSQQHPLLRFVGDGTGQGVLWECVR